MVKPAGYWTFPRCHIEAIKCKSRTEYKRKSTSYHSAKRNGWLDDVCSHMIATKRFNGYWTFELCRIEALKYQTRTDFVRGSGGAFNAARRKGWLKNICTHMTTRGDRYKRFVYTIKNEKKRIVYVGLSYNPLIRFKNHKVKGAAKELCNSGGVLDIVSELISAELAQETEHDLIQHYVNLNWKVLNRAKAGSLGSTDIKWTFEKCQQEALKYSTKNEFYLGNRYVYLTAHKNGWFNAICGHMPLRARL